MRHSLTTLTLVLVVFAASCGGTPKQLSAPPQMVVFVRPEPAANDGRVFYLVVKEVDESQFSNDVYSMIEAIVTEDDWGPDVIGVYSVIPGREHKIIMRKPSYRPVGFYCLFSAPEEKRWKVLLPQPVGSKYNLWISENKASVSKRMSTW